MTLPYVVWVLCGAVATMPIFWLYRRVSPAGQCRLWSNGLVVAALVYVAFALWGHADGPWLGIEAAGVVIYGGVAWWGRRRAPWLALGWALHVLWDVLLHGGGLGHGADFVPAWYPPVCLGFDLAVAGYLATLSRRGR